MCFVFDVIVVLSVFVCLCGLPVFVSYVWGLLVWCLFCLCSTTCVFLFVCVCLFANAR